MTKYPNIAKYMGELKITHTVFNRQESDDLISASDLEALLAHGVEVYGAGAVLAALSSNKYTYDTHIGLLIGYNLIEVEKPVSGEEVCEILNRIVERHAIHFDEIRPLISRIKKCGVK